MLQLNSAENFIKEGLDILEPCADSVCRGAGLAAVGAGIPLEVMAGRRDDLSLFYSFAANGAHLVAGVTGLGAAGLDRVAELGLVAEGADIVFRVAFAAGAGVGRVALLSTGRGGHGLDKVVGVCLALAAAGADTVFVIVAESVDVSVGRGLAALAAAGREALLCAVRRSDNRVSEGVNMPLSGGVPRR